MSMVRTSPSSKWTMAVRPKYRYLPSRGLDNKGFDVVHLIVKSRSRTAPPFIPDLIYPLSILGPLLQHRHLRFTVLLDRWALGCGPFIYGLDITVEVCNTFGSIVSLLQSVFQTIAYYNRPLSYIRLHPS